MAYASQLFGDSAPHTEALAAATVWRGFKAAKFGWGPIGRLGLAADIEQIEAARGGLGLDLALMIDTGCVFGHDLDEAALRIPAIEDARSEWWEEPFMTGALAEYAELAGQTDVPLAGGEGCHTADQARHFMQYGGLKYIQIDTGRIGGITVAREVAVVARRMGVRYVNHTFTSNLALSASLQPFADAPEGGFAEVPVAASDLAVAIGGPVWELDSEGCVRAPDGPGLGVVPRIDAIKPYLQDVEIRWKGRTIWRSPEA
jgi:L-alanine-DL-glutamate epimerase-like enolase superfamily enzyme